jgi:predicted lipoprotein
MTHISLRSRFAALLIPAMLAGCAAPAAAPSAPAPSAAPALTVGAVLPQLAANIILPAYQTLDARAIRLHDAALALQAAPTDANLQAARQAWQEARTSWEVSESHLFGPVKDQEIDPALDSWPVNKTDLDKVLASNVTLDAAFIASQQPTLKGFHVIEYVLYGNQAAGLDARKLTYLTALTGEFKASTAKLRQAWEPTGGKFAEQYGTGAAFGSADAAFAETLGALAEICEEVAGSKIETPLAAKDPNLEESQFSGATLTDFRNNLLGVQAIYLGRYGDRQGLGISQLVAAKNPAVDARVRQLLDQALADLQAVPGTFGEAIVKNPDALRKAQASINAVRDALKKDVSVTLTGKVVADAT